MLIRYLIGSALIFALLFAFVRKIELRRKWALPWILVISPLSIWLSSNLPPFPFAAFFILHLAIAFFLAIFASLLTILCLFYRDPHRVPPADPGTILSPADGRIIYIKELRDSLFPIAVKRGKSIPLVEFTAVPFPVKNGLQIGIMMSYLDVHINRAPIAGRIEEVQKIPGAFHSLKQMGSLLENERVFTIIAGAETKIGVVQISSRIVRRIVPFIKRGDDVRQGDRIGMIRFGSQVDVLIPESRNVAMVAKVGDYLQAGMSVLAKYRKGMGDELKG